MATCSREPAGRVPAVPGFLPASGVDGQSRTWGRCISLVTAAVGNWRSNRLRRAQHRTPSCQGPAEPAPAAHPLACALVSSERIAPFIAVERERFPLLHLRV